MVSAVTVNQSHEYRPSQPVAAKQLVNGVPKKRVFFNIRARSRFGLRMYRCMANKTTISGNNSRMGILGLEQAVLVALSLGTAHGTDAARNNHSEIVFTDSQAAVLMADRVSG